MYVDPCLLLWEKERPSAWSSSSIKMAPFFKDIRLKLWPSGINCGIPFSLLGVGYGTYRGRHRKCVQCSGGPKEENYGGGSKEKDVLGWMGGYNADDEECIGT